MRTRSSLFAAAADERMGSEEEEKFGSDSASAIKYTLGFIVTLFVAVQAFFAVYNGYIID